MQPSFKQPSCGVLFSDVDGTLCFHQSQHGIRQVQALAGGTVLVEDSQTRQTCPAFVVTPTGSGYLPSYLAVETRRLCFLLRQKFDFILVTGARLSTVLSRQNRFDFASAVILENGGMILDSNGLPDPDWDEYLKPGLKNLAEAVQMLSAAGWVMNNAGRTTMLRVRAEDNPQRSPAEFEALCQNLTLPDGLKKTINMTFLDIILSNAGKDNAVHFLLQKLGYDPSLTFGIGDDINDLEFLEKVAHPFMLASAFPQALKTARARGWSISKSPTFEGINEILNTILRL